MAKPLVGQPDDFEFQYKKRFEVELSARGLIVKYEEDRAGLDLGVHLYAERTRAGASVSTVRVWFQIKGITATKLNKNCFEQSEFILVEDLPVDLVRYWYALPEPVYLAIFIEAGQAFLAEDIREVVDRMGGPSELRDRLTRGEKTMTLKIRSGATLDEAFARMPTHRSLRLDGPYFRGRPLGHRFDPLRSELDELDPRLFHQVVHRLLEVHSFRPTEELQVDRLLEGQTDGVELLVGTLYLTYEWTSPLFTEFGYDPGSDFRIESPPFHAHGLTLVAIQSREQPPTFHAEAQSVLSDLKAQGVENALVFMNTSESGQPGAFGTWRVGLQPFNVLPQGLGSLGFNVLTTTQVFLEFLDRISWRYLNPL